LKIGFDYEALLPFFMLDIIQSVNVCWASQFMES
jgi:hypothetical protein